MKPRKILSFLLATAMTISLLPTFTLTASAGETPTTTTEKNITLSTSALSGYDSTNGYDYIYYGTYNNKAVKWCVLDMAYNYDKNNSNNTGMLVLSENALAKAQFGTNSTWSGSTAQNWCNSMYNSSFGTGEVTKEKDFIWETTSTDNILSNDYLFFLSNDEADNRKYFPNDGKRIAYLNGIAVRWWLRSPYYDEVTCVLGDSFIDHYLPYDDLPAARPAFNLNSSSVLFTSSKGVKAIDEGSIKKNENYEPGTDEKYEYKLTMKDSDRNFALTDTSAKTVKSGGELSLGYSGAKTGESEYISAMIVKGGKVLHYGQLAQITAASGEVSFNIPTDIDGGTYELRLFNEQINGDYKTDFSSAFQTVTLNVKGIPAISDFTFNEPSNSTYDGNAKAATVTSDKSGMGEITVKYYDESGSLLTEAPKNTGTYKVKIDVAKGTNYDAANNLTADNWKFTIEKAENEWLNEPQLDGWRYLQTPSEPLYRAGFGDAKIEYKKASDDDALYSETVPTNAGDYKARFTIEGTDNYNGISKIVPFTISKLEIEKPTIADKIYTGMPLKADVPVSGSYTVSQNEHVDKGTYDVILTLTDQSNCKWEDTDEASVTLTFNITTAENEWLNEPQLDGWIYLQPASSPVSAAKFGTVKVEYKKSSEADDKYTTVAPTNAGDYKARFSVEATNNYGMLSKEVDFTINKEKVTKPAENTTLFTYNKDVQTYSLTESELYTISNNTRTDAGSQDVTVALKDTDNYEWADGTTKDLTYTFTIKEAKITPTITLTAPVKYATPETSIETDEYTAAVVWSPTVEANDTFAKNTEYTATITVTPKANYTTDGITGYVIDGAETVTLNTDGTITAVFPKTAGSSGGGGTSRYTVKFDTDSGNTITNQTVTKNSKATKPTAPTKEGYIFDGWYTDSKFTTEYDFDTKVTKNITLYAKWIEDEVQEPSDDKKDDNDNPTPSEWKNPFTDVTKADWFFDNVRYANENGLMSGVTSTEFAPNDSLTRAMLVTVLWRADGEPVVNYAMPFTDIIDTAYYAEAVRWAASENIVNGVTETEFAPDENITREQIAAIIYRYAKYKGYDVSVGEDTNILSYTDFDEISEYAIEAMQYAVGSGLIKGKTESTLNPKDNATRAEIAAILNRFIESNK